MRVWDAKNTIYHDLRALPWRRYLSAMWILCGELQLLFEGRLTDGERSMMASTLEMVRTAVIEDGIPDSVAAAAAELAAKWEKLATDREDEVLPGQWNVWITFADLAAELAGTTRQYKATERLTLAAAESWREPYPGRVRRIDPNEEADDDSPMARTLATFVRIVSGVGQALDSDTDPAVMRTRILLNPWHSATECLW